MNAAANSPAEGEADISDVRRYIANAVSPEKPGARSTQMFLMSTGIERSRRRWYMAPEVTMRPGYNVPPVTLPKGCHVPGQQY